MVTHVLWDWNGTLLDDVDLVIDVMNGLLADKQLPALDRARYRTTFDFPVRDYYARLGLVPQHGSFEQWARLFVDEYDRRARDVPVRPLGRTILAQLRARGLGQVMLSASRAQHLREMVDLHDLGAYFDELLALDDHYAHGKVDVARAWLERSGHDPAGLLMIGDTLHDHEVACSIGAACVLVADGHHDEERLRACGCAVVSGLEELYTADTPLRELLA
jgi:phosphoglycolate phosphatase